MKKSRCFTAIPAILILAFFSWAFPAPDAEGIELGVGSGTTDYRPGETNPVSNPARSYLLAEDQLGVATHNTHQTMLQFWNAPTGDSLKDWKNLSGSNNHSVPKCNIKRGPVALAKGRVHSVLKDSAVFAIYSDYGSVAKPVVGFIDCPGNCIYTIPGSYYEGIPSGTFSTIEIETGDIDGEVNQEGERRDEIIIAYRKKMQGRDTAFG